MFFQQHSFCGKPLAIYQNLLPITASYILHPELPFLREQFLQNNCEDEYFATAALLFIIINFCINELFYNRAEPHRILL